MKKAISVILTLVFLLPAAMTFANAAAITMNDWSVLGEGKHNTLKQVGNGVQFSSEGRYQGDANGILYNNAVDLTDFSFSMKIDQRVALNPKSDAWLGISLLNKKGLADINDGKKGEGLFIIIRPIRDDGVATFQMYPLLDGVAFGNPVKTKDFGKFQNGETHTLRFQLSGNSIKVSLNGTVMDDCGWFDGTFADKKGYFSLLASDNKSALSTTTVTKINGQDAITPVGQSSSSTSPTTSAKVTPGSTTITPGSSTSPVSTTSSSSSGATSPTDTLSSGSEESGGESNGTGNAVTTEASSAETSGRKDDENKGVSPIVWVVIAVVAAAAIGGGAFLLIKKFKK